MRVVTKHLLVCVLVTTYAVGSAAASKALIQRSRHAINRMAYSCAYVLASDRKLDHLAKEVLKNINWRVSPTQSKDWGWFLKSLRSDPHLLDEAYVTIVRKNDSEQSIAFIEYLSTFGRRPSSAKLATLLPNWPGLSPQERLEALLGIHNKFDSTTTDPVFKSVSQLIQDPSMDFDTRQVMLSKAIKYLVEQKITLANGAWTSFQKAIETVVDAKGDMMVSVDGAGELRSVTISQQLESGVPLLDANIMTPGPEPVQRAVSQAIIKKSITEAGQFLRNTETLAAAYETLRIAYIYSPQEWGQAVLTQLERHHLELIPIISTLPPLKELPINYPDQLPNAICAYNILTKALSWPRQDTVENTDKDFMAQTIRGIEEAANDPAPSIRRAAQLAAQVILFHQQRPARPSSLWQRLHKRHNQELVTVPYASIHGPMSHMLLVQVAGPQKDWKDFLLTRDRMLLMREVFRPNGP